MYNGPEGGERVRERSQVAERARAKRGNRSRNESLALRGDARAEERRNGIFEGGEFFGMRCYGAWGKESYEVVEENVKFIV